MSDAVSKKNHTQNTAHIAATVMSMLIVGTTAIIGTKCTNIVSLEVSWMALFPPNSTVTSISGYKWNMICSK